jgi:hypothetical protein
MEDKAEIGKAESGNGESFGCQRSEVRGQRSELAYFYQMGWVK